MAMGNSRKKSIIGLALSLAIICCIILYITRSESEVSDSESIDTVKDTVKAAYLIRTDRYCHTSIIDAYDEFSRNSHEGELPPELADNYELVHAHVVARHGDRSPAKSMKIGSSVFYKCGLTDWNSAFGWEGLSEFAHPQPMPLAGVKIQKSHIDLYPGSSSKRCGVGKLTKTGYTQHYRLGSMLSQKYKDLMNNFQDIDSLSQNIFVQSTGVTRTIRSAAAFMLGFLPNDQRLRQKTTVYISPDRELVLASPPPGVKETYKYCKHISRFERNQLKKTNYYETDRTIYHPYLEKAIKMFHLTDKEPDIRQLFDHFLTRACHSPEDPLPCRGDVCIDYPFATKLLEAADWDWVNFYTQNASLVTMLPFLRHSVLEQMEKITSGSVGVQPIKFALSLAHDTTLAQILSAIGIRQYEWMPYASRVVFELWRSKTERKDNEQFRIRVLFNGVPVTSELSLWNGVQASDGDNQQLVPYSKWVEFITTGNYRDTQSYEKACGIKTFP